MAYINKAISERVSYGFDGGPEFSNEVVPLENGYEHIDASWQYPRCRYSAKYENIDDDTKEYFVQLFNACRGKLHAFMFQDWNDYKAVNEPLAVEAGTNKKVQLYKTYKFGEAFSIRPIQALSEGDLNNRDPNFRHAAPKVFTEGGNEVMGTFDTATGEFTPSEVWGTGAYTWSAWFFVWVRFDTDHNSMAINSWNNSSISVELYEKKREVTATNMPTSWAG